MEIATIKLPRYLSIDGKCRRNKKLITRSDVDTRYRYWTKEEEKRYMYSEQEERNARG